MHFISIEGTEGSGKSLLVQSLVKMFRTTGYEIVVTREPGGIAIAESIRSILLDPANREMDSRTEALLYAAARRQHLVEKIIPALSRGALVICDRFIHSSLAYQGYARGLGIDEVFEINRFAVDNCMPSLTIYLDIDPEIGLTRIHKDASREINRIDLESLCFHRKVREGYHRLCQIDENMKSIDANQLPDQVAADAWMIIQKHLKFVH